MTTVTIKANGNVRDVDVAGHACYDLAGKDVVCAGVSTLSYTLAQALSRMEAEGELDVMSIDMHSGHCFFHAVPINDEQSRVKLQTIVTTIADGFRLLADKYPANVNVIGPGGENASEAK